MLNLRNLSNACALKERDRRLTWCRIVRSNVMFFNHPAILYVCEEKNVPYTMNTIRLNLVFILIVNNGHWFQHQCGKRVVIHDENKRYIYWIVNIFQFSIFEREPILRFLYLYIYWSLYWKYGCWEVMCSSIGITGLTMSATYCQHRCSSFPRGIDIYMDIQIKYIL